MLTELAMKTVVTAGTFAKIAIQQWQTNATIVAWILIARAGQTIVNFGIVLRHVNSKILICLPVDHQSLHRTNQSGRGIS